MRISLLLAVLLSLLIPARLAGAAERQCFVQTEMCIEGRFLEYWRQNGGLAVFGYPITEAREELNRDTGMVHLTQWFERNRFELHPEYNAPYDVLLGRLGDERLMQEGRDWRMVPRESGPMAGCLWFEATGHNVCDQAAGAGIKTYWESHGLADPLLGSYNRSLALFGLPLTTAQMEVNDSGDYVMTQWFERARLEWHPDKPAEYRVLLGLLGTEALTDQSATSWAPEVTLAGGRTFFAAGDGSHGMELWVSDGVGTRMLKDICLGACNATPCGSS